MRDVKFRVFPATGDVMPPWQNTSLDRFLLLTPIFFYELKVFGMIPPIHVLNEKLTIGSYDAGMGGACEWKSFEINADEYAELVMELTTNPDYKISEDEKLKKKQN